MADEDPDAEQSREHHRPFVSLAASRWKDKLKDKASKLAKGSNKPASLQHEQNVSDFLRPSPQSSPPPRPTANSKSSSSGLSIVPVEDRLDPTSYAPPPPAPSKKRKPKGLHVSFSNQEPEIIGEGGDEAELPSKDVKGSWTPSSTPSDSHKLDADQPEQPKQSLAPPQLLQVGHDAGSRRVSVQRAPTRKPVGGWEKKRMSMNLEEGLVKAQKFDASESRPEEEDLVFDQTSQSRRGPVDEASESKQVEPATVPLRLRSDYRPPSFHIEDRSSSHEAFVPYNPSMPVVVPESSTNPQNSSSPIRRTGQAPITRDRPTGSGPEETHSLLKSQWPSEGSVERLHQRTGSSTSETYSERRPSQPHIPILDDVSDNRAESHDFYARVQHLRGVFRLAAEKFNAIEEQALEHWLRASAWWFLRGKLTLESNLKSVRLDKNGPNGQASTKTSPQSQQCYVDLAKAWWVMEDILPDHIGPHGLASIRNTLDSFDGLDYSDLRAVYQTIVANMQGFAIFMARNNLMPPQAILIQGADPTVWIDYPTVPPPLLPFTAAKTLTKRPRDAFFPILFADTARHFSYGRVFAEAEIVSEDGVAEDSQLPCILSIIRQRNNSQVEITIASQDGQINIHIQSDPEFGQTWKDVEWKVKSHSLRIRFPGGFQMALRLWDQDFKTIWGIHDYIRRVQAEMQPKDNEELVFDHTVNTFHLVATPESTETFPSRPVRHCRARLFRRMASLGAGTGNHKVYDGTRLSIVTPPTTKTLSSMGRYFGKRSPILFSNLRGENDAPALLLALMERSQKTSMILTFQDVTKRTELHMLMTGLFIRPDESRSKDIPVQQMSIVEVSGAGVAASESLRLPPGLQWQHLNAINQKQASSPSQFVLSDRLRIVTSCNYGTITDLVNLGKYFSLLVT